jgi:Icc protein
MSRRIDQLQPSDLDRARASVAPLSDAVASAKAEAGEDAVVVGWLSDMHIHSEEDYRAGAGFYSDFANSEANFELALAEVRALKPSPDVVVLGGDLTNTNTLPQYEAFSRILDRCWQGAALPPLLPLRGNHDQFAFAPAAARFAEHWTTFARPDWPAPIDSSDALYYEVEHKGWRFVAIDPLNRPFTEKQKPWIESRLAPGASDRPTIVLCHIPIVAVGNWVDQHAVTDPRVVRAIDGSDSVRLVLSGHTHKAAAWMYRRKVHAVFPACAYGIDDACGWGVVVLGRGQVHSIFVKELAAPAFDHVSWQLTAQEGRFRRLETPLFENSPLLNPYILPRHERPEDRC